MSVNKWKKDSLLFSRVTNKDLTCHNCKFAFDDTKILKNTSTCEKYKIKPSGVLLGKNDCDVKEVVKK